jgi:predicted nucleic acid-binding protein
LGVKRKPELLFFDSNVYINLLRSPSYEKRIEQMLQGGYLYVVNKIVLMELWAGAKTTLEENILRDHQKAFPLIGMHDDQFIAAGQLMSRMQKKHRFEAKVRRNLTWDLLIALSARENNALLITENNADFRNIRKWIEFEYMSVPENEQLPNDAP